MDLDGTDTSGFVILDGFGVRLQFGGPLLLIPVLHVCSCEWSLVTVLFSSGPAIVGIYPAYRSCGHPKRSVRRNLAGRDYLQQPLVRRYGFAPQPE